MGVRGQARCRVRAPGGQPADLCPQNLVSAPHSSGLPATPWEPRQVGLVGGQLLSPCPKLGADPRKPRLPQAPSFPGESKQNMACPTASAVRITPLVSHN